MKKLLLCITEQNKYIDLIKYSYHLAQYINTDLELVLIRQSSFQSADISAIEAYSLVLPFIPMDETENEVAGRFVKDLFTKNDIDFSAFSWSEYGDLFDILDKKLRHGEFGMLVLPRTEDEVYWPYEASHLQIIAELKCPIWLIDPSAEFKPFEKVIYASNYSKLDEQMINRFVHLTNKKIGTIKLAHVSYTDSFQDKIFALGFESYLNKQLQDIHVKVTYLPAVASQVKIHEVFLMYAHQNKADLIVILKQDKSFIENLVYSSFTKKALIHMQCPVFILHERIIR
ncbi:MAG: universal stress protein [Tannerellaceae bacterium]